MPINKLWTRKRYAHKWKENMREQSNKKALVDLACELGRKTVLYEEMLEAIKELNTIEGVQSILHKYKAEFENSGLKTPLFGRPF